MKSIALVVCRVALIAGCGVAAWRSVQTARADWIASAGTIEALERAKQYAPNDARLLSRIAIAKSSAGDESPAVDEELRRAAQMNPYDSGVLMALGLREEFRGDRAKAESDLVRATEVDAQFKPAWTLANFYARTGQPDKSWPMIERILNLTPLGYDPTAVFELCWSAADGDSRRILSLIPKDGHRPVQYLAFLITTRKTQAAIEAWPEALRATDAGDAGDAAVLSAFVDAMSNAGRTTEAVQAWNELVDRGMIQSGKVDPAKGGSIADPDFEFPLNGRGFEWALAEIAGVTTYASGGSLRMEITGDEPESFQMLSVWAPVMAGKRYRLTWKSDGAMLREPKDPGFMFRIVPQGGMPTLCGPLLTTSTCDFAGAAGEGTGKAAIQLAYTRAPGTTRISGTLQLSGVHVELAP